MSQKPNIMFFFADDMRFDTISALGNDQIFTPNIDKLVEKGTTLTHMHIPGGTTGAICLPSRAMLHTSKTLFHLCDNGNIIPKDHMLLGETLQSEGYRTFGTGKWHNGTESYARSFTDGGEIFFGGMQDHWNVPAHNFDPAGKYSSRTLKINNCMLDNKEEEFICDHVVPGKHSSQLFCDAVIDFIKQYDNNKPFFAYVSFMAPHDPRTMPKRFRDMYDPEEIELPPNFMAYHPVKYGNEKGRDELLAPYPRTQEDTRRQIAEYYGIISHLDYEMGRVIKTLEEEGLVENTIVIFVSDNGLAVGQHGLFGKQNHFEHSIRVPFIISGPDIPGNQRRDSFAYLLDIYPTICDLINIRIPDSVEGKSFYKMLNDENLKIREKLYFAFNNKIRSIKDNRYKLMKFVHKGKLITRLYDIWKDPWELADLYGMVEHQNTIKRLEKEMQKLRDEWDDEKHPLGESYWTQYRKVKK